MSYCDNSYDISHLFNTPKRKVKNKMKKRVYLLSKREVDLIVASITNGKDLPDDLCERQPNIVDSVLSLIDNMNDLVHHYKKMKDLKIRRRYFIRELYTIKTEKQFDKWTDAVEEFLEDLEV